MSNDKLKEKLFEISQLVENSKKIVNQNVSWPQNQKMGFSYCGLVGSQI